MQGEQRSFSQRSSCPTKHLQYPLFLTPLAVQSPPPRPLCNLSHSAILREGRLYGETEHRDVHHDLVVLGLHDTLQDRANTFKAPYWRLSASDTPGPPSSRYQVCFLLFFFIFVFTPRRAFA